MGNPTFPFASAIGAAVRRRGEFVPISSSNLPIVISLIAPLLKQKKKKEEVKLIRAFIQSSFANPSAATPKSGLRASRALKGRGNPFAVVKRL